MTTLESIGFTIAVVRYFTVHFRFYSVAGSKRSTYRTNHAVRQLAHQMSFTIQTQAPSKSRRGNPMSAGSLDLSLSYTHVKWRSGNWEHEKGTSGSMLKANLICGGPYPLSRHAYRICTSDHSLCRYSHACLPIRAVLSIVGGRRSITCRLCQPHNPTNYEKPLSQTFLPY
jgi:hypothetical protein